MRINNKIKNNYFTWLIKIAPDLKRRLYRLSIVKVDGKMVGFLYRPVYINYLYATQILQKKTNSITIYEVYFLSLQKRCSRLVSDELFSMLHPLFHRLKDASLSQLYSHAKSTDELHTLVPPILHFTAQNLSGTYTGMHDSHSFHILLVRRNAYLDSLFQKKKK